MWLWPRSVSKLGHLFSRHVVMPRLAGFMDACPNDRIEFHATQDTRAIQSENLDGSTFARLFVCSADGGVM